MSRPELVVAAVEGIGEVHPGDDLAALVAARVVLADGDVVVVTSKAVSKAEGRVRTLPRDQAVAEESDRVVARRGPTTIARTRHGLVMAAAGVDASNTAVGTVVLLPLDPDASARRLRDRIAELAGVRVGVVVTDTSGRAWRTGQTDVAVGAAGVLVLDDHAGRVDAYGNPLAVTAPALADEVAGAADLVTGKLSGCPAAVVRGLGHLVLADGEHGPGAAALVRPEAGDMFGLGAREAARLAVAPGPPAHDVRRGFGAPAAAETLAAALAEVLGGSVTVTSDGPGRVVVDGTCPDDRSAGRAEVRCAALARAHGWQAEPQQAGGSRVLVTCLPLGP